MKRTLSAVCTTTVAAVLSTAATAADMTRHTPVATHMAPVGGLPLVMVAQAGTSNNDALMLLLDQFQSMRSELDVLRGMVEEQGYEIRRLQRDSLDRYTDLDSRISALYQDIDQSMQGAGAAAGVSSAPGSTAGAAVSPTPLTGAADSQTGSMQAGSSALGQPATSGATPAVGSSPTLAGGQSASAGGATAVTGVGLAGAQSSAAPVGMMTEQQLYELALDSLLQQGAYERSIAEFNTYLSEYPDGRFVTNAYYWQGQAYVNLSMFEEARDAFEVILNDYPDGRKIEDAMYSLGTVYHRLGDSQRARQLLLDVRTRFPNTSAANLADIYLRSLN